MEEGFQPLDLQVGVDIFSTNRRFVPPESRNIINCRFIANPHKRVLNFDLKMTSMLKKFTPIPSKPSCVLVSLGNSLRDQQPITCKYRYNNIQYTEYVWMVQKSFYHLFLDGNLQSTNSMPQRSMTHVRCIPPATLAPPQCPKVSNGGTFCHIRQQWGVHPWFLEFLRKIVENQWQGSSNACWHINTQCPGVQFVVSVNAHESWIILWEPIKNPYKASDSTCFYMVKVQNNIQLSAVKLVGWCGPHSARFLKLGATTAHGKHLRALAFDLTQFPAISYGFVHNLVLMWRRILQTIWFWGYRITV